MYIIKHRTQAPCRLPPKGLPVPLRSPCDRRPVPAHIHTSSRHQHSYDAVDDIYGPMDPPVRDVVLLLPVVRGLKPPADVSALLAWGMGSRRKPLQCPHPQGLCCPFQASEKHSLCLCPPPDLSYRPL